MSEDNSPADMPIAKPESKFNNIVKQLIMAVFAIGLLYLSFRGCDLPTIWAYTVKTNPIYLILLCLSGLLSHVARSMRWILLLKPLSDHKISLWNSFVAVITGYAVNVAIPRGGEVVRLLSMTRSENLPWAGVLSTMLIDRLLDIALLVFLLGATLLVLPKSILSDMPWLVPGGLAMTVATIAGMFVLPHVAKIMRWFLQLAFVQTKLPAPLVKKLEDLSDQFGIGTKSLTDPVAYPAIAFLSVVIWFFYWLNLYLTVLAFNLQDKVTLANSLIVFTISSVGVLVPTPGSVGSYHFLTSQALVLTSGINKEQALAFASVLHLFCFILVTCIPAFICVMIQSGKMGVKKTEHQI